MKKARAELDLLVGRFAKQGALLNRLVHDGAVPAVADIRREVESAASEVAPELPHLRLVLSRPAVGVAALLVDKSVSPVRVLIGQRQSSHGSGRYACPGGHLEGGESFEACAAREAVEETGVAIPGDGSRWRLLTTTNDWMEAEELHYITVFMTASLTAEEKGAVRNLEPDKCVSWEWLTLEEVRGLPLFMPMMNFLRAGVEALV